MKESRFVLVLVVLELLLMDSDEQAGRMKLLGMEVKQNMGVRMDGTSFE